MEYVLQRLEAAGITLLPSLARTVACLEIPGNRPEELRQALGQMHANASSGVKPDQLRMGSLAMAAFSRVVRADAPGHDPFSAEAAAGYAKVVGREVRTDKIQPVVNDLLADNIFMCRSHGR